MTIFAIIISLVYTFVNIFSKISENIRKSELPIRSHSDLNVAMTFKNPTTYNGTTVYRASGGHICGALCCYK